MGAVNQGSGTKHGAIVLWLGCSTEGRWKSRTGIPALSRAAKKLWRRVRRFPIVEQNFWNRLSRDPKSCLKSWLWEEGLVMQENSDFKNWDCYFRSYPIPFGLRVQRLVAQAAGVAAGCVDPPPGDAPQVFLETMWGDLWEEAKVLDVCIFLRGSKHLDTSSRWKSVFPTGVPLV